METPDKQAQIDAARARESALHKQIGECLKQGKFRDIQAFIPELRSIQAEIKELKEKA